MPYDMSFSKLIGAALAAVAVVMAFMNVDGWVWFLFVVAVVFA